MCVTLITINFRLFNANKKYKVLIKVKDEDSAIAVSTEILTTKWLLSTKLNSFLY